MIKLKDQQPFAKGTHRACYRHPARPDLCIKVMIEEWTDNKRWRKIPKYLRPFRSKWSFHENLTELRFSRQLEKRIGDKGWNYIPQSHDLVETDLGEGMTVDLIRNHDNTIAVTLGEYLWRHGLTPECQQAIDEMWAGCREHLIFAGGRPDNVAISVNADGSCKCYCIDEFGLSSFIPFPMFIPSAARKKFDKLRANQRKDIEKILKRKEEAPDEQGKGFLLPQDDQ